MKELCVYDIMIIGIGIGMGIGSGWEGITVLSTYSV